MIYKILGVGALIGVIISSLYGLAYIAVLVVLPIIVCINILRLRYAQTKQEVPKDLKFIETLRGSREAFLWGYVIHILLALGWLTLLVIYYFRQ